MQEHGLVTRVFLIYRRAIALIGADEELPGEFIEMCVGPQRYGELARAWAERERKLRASFRDYARELAAIEDALGIGLAQFTAVAPPRHNS